MGLNIKEVWLSRADLAESAIHERHARPLWNWPRTNLGLVSWPPTAQDHWFMHWHYWWQAHYVNCLVDAAERVYTSTRKKRIRRTLRGIRLRNVAPLRVNKLYDDRTWLALAMNRVRALDESSKSKSLLRLEQSILNARVEQGVVPWKVGSDFYNVPTNGPVAILLARNGDIAGARRIVDWIWENLRNERGLIMDGLHNLNNPRIEQQEYTYCQGVVIGACVEIAQALRSGGEVTAEADAYLNRVSELIEAVHRHMANNKGVLSVENGSGDGGLFKGILVDYLAQAVVRMPEHSEAQARARRLAMRMVIASAESVWRHRLEVDGLPLFAADWAHDAKLPGMFSGTQAKKQRVAERDFSVQLSGWLLMEAAAKVAHELTRHLEETPGMCSEGY